MTCTLPPRAIPLSVCPSAACKTIRLVLVKTLLSVSMVSSHNFCYNQQKTTLSLFYDAIIASSPIWCLNVIRGRLADQISTHQAAMPTK